MPKDLLEQLRQNNVIPENGQNPAPEEAPAAGDSSMNEFLAEVAQLREMVEKIQGYVNQVRNKHSELLSMPQQNERTKQELEELTCNIKSLAGTVRQRLKVLEISINQQEEEDPSGATVRLQRTQHNTITRRFMDVMTDYNRAQASYRDACKTQLRAKLEIAGRPVDDDKLEEMMESGDVQVFTQGILGDTQQAQQAMADIEARHNDIMKLEKSIREIHELFLELATLVDSQGEMVDRIEHNVANTRDHVEAAKITLHSARRYKAKSKKKKIICFSVLGVILLLLVVILIAALVPKN